MKSLLFSARDCICCQQSQIHRKIHFDLILSRGWYGDHTLELSARVVGCRETLVSDFYNCHQDGCLNFKARLAVSCGCRFLDSFLCNRTLIFLLSVGTMEVQDTICHRHDPPVDFRFTLIQKLFPYCAPTTSSVCLLQDSKWIDRAFLSRVL